MVRQSVIQLMAHACNSFICVILALVQLGETLKWQVHVVTGAPTTQTKNNHRNHRVGDAYNNELIDADGFYSALHYEIALASLMGVITCIFTFFCFKLIHQVHETMS